tara:strand:- start:6614 stop:8092 length:1479 start_codon:yes stop_codon:yes gene_type:complete
MLLLKNKMFFIPRLVNLKKYLVFPMQFKKVLSYSFGPLGGALFSFITLPLIANFFSVEDLGRFSILQVSLSIGVMLFSLGLDQAFVREFHEYDNKPGLAKVMMLPNVLFFPLLIILFYFSPIIGSVLDFNGEFSSILIALTLCLYILNNQLGYIFRMEEKGFVYSLTIITPKVVFFITTLVVIYGYKEFNFEYLILANFLSISATTIISVLCLSKGFFKPLKLDVDFVQLKKMLNFGLPLIIAGLAYTGLTTLDRFFIKSLSTLHEVGVYALALGFASIAGIFSSIFSSMWHPILYRWVSEGVKISRIIMSIEVMILFLSFSWSFLGVFSFILVPFVPDSYQNLNYLFVAAVGVPLIYILSEVTQVGIGISRRTSFSILASVVALVVNVTLNVILIPDYGASGAAIATLIAFLVFFTVRTESSVFLWQSFPRKKVYIILVLYISLSIALQFYHVSFVVNSCLWMVLFLTTLIFFNARVKTLYFVYLRKRGRS